jgi:hypothetical protein
MARNGIFRRRQASAEASRDPALVIDQCVAIVTLALFLCPLGAVAFAAERGTAEQRRGCMPDVFKYCGTMVDDYDTLLVESPPTQPLLSAPIGEAANAGAKTEQLV